MGTVVIQLAGRYRGKRAVVLKQLSSGLLLVTGPYQVNGVPLRRVNQAYVIATSTKLGVKGLKVNLDDKDFARDADRKKHQNGVDKDLVAQLKKDATLKKYMKARFSLSSNMLP